jgi:hypothetical protein
MNTPRQALLLVGSAKRPRSTSESLGTYLLERLGEQGFATETLLLHRALRSEAGRQELLDATDRADLLVLAFPLYVDTLPAMVTWALEHIASHRAGTPRRGQRLVALANCGFPEAHHNDTALAICRHFAQEAGLAWAGGLALGAGQAIDGRPLSEAGGMARHVVESLGLAAEALAAGDPVPRQAVDIMARSFMPAWAYMRMGGLAWRMQARKHGAHRRLDACPYAGGSDHASTH